MDDDSVHSTASHWRSALSYIMREATAIEARANPCIIDVRMGREDEPHRRYYYAIEGVPATFNSITTEREAAKTSRPRHGKGY